MLRWARSGSYRRGGGNARLQLINVPSSAEREALKARWKELRDHMHNQNKQIVVASLIELLGCYRNALRAGEDARDVALKYCRELDGLPTWAIVRACEQIRGGGYAEHKTHPPSTMALRLIARSYCELPTQEMHEIAEVLQGETAPEAISAAEKDRVQGLLTDLAGELKAGGEDERRVMIERNTKPLKPWDGKVTEHLATIVRKWEKEAEQK